MLRSMERFNAMDAPADQVIARVMLAWSKRDGRGIWPTQAEVGEILGVSQHHVSEINSGKKGMGRSARKLAAIYLEVHDYED